MMRLHCTTLLIVTMKHCLAVPLNMYDRTHDERLLGSSTFDKSTLAAYTETIHTTTNKERDVFWNETHISPSTAEINTDFFILHIGVLTIGSVGGLLALVSILSLIRFHHEQLRAKGYRSPVLSPWMDRFSGGRSSLATGGSSTSPWRWTAIAATNPMYKPQSRDPVQYGSSQVYSGRKQNRSDRVVLKRSPVHSQIIGLGISVDRAQLEDHLQRLSQAQPRPPPRKSVRFETRLAELPRLRDFIISETPSVQSWTQFAQNGFM